MRPSNQLPAFLGGNPERPIVAVHVGTPGVTGFALHAPAVAGRDRQHEVTTIELQVDRSGRSTQRAVTPVKRAHVATTGTAGPEPETIDATGQDPADDDPERSRDQEPAQEGPARSGEQDPDADPDQDQGPQAPHVADLIDGDESGANRQWNRADDEEEEPQAEEPAVDAHGATLAIPRVTVMAEGHWPVGRLACASLESRPRRTVQEAACV